MEGQIKQEVRREHRSDQGEAEVVAKGLCNWAVAVAEVAARLGQEVYHGGMDLEMADAMEVALANGVETVVRAARTAGEVVEVEAVSMIWIENDCVNLGDVKEVNET